MFLPQVESSVLDLSKFTSLVKLVTFAPFKTAVAALENINAISEGIVPQDLLVVLDEHFANLKKKKCCLGIADAKLGAAITEAIGVQCNHMDAVPEIIRGIRFHFHKLVKGNKHLPLIIIINTFVPFSQIGKLCIKPLFLYTTIFSPVRARLN